MDKLQELGKKIRDLCLEFGKAQKKQQKADKDASEVNQGPKSALKAKRESKAQAKAEAKISKGVKFSADVETHIIGERKWNDYKTKGHTFKKGNFTPDEIKKLMDALCQYVKQQNESDALETLTMLCTRSKHELPEELKGAWPKIAECLQDRSVQSCHNVCKRKFNPSNYHGNWTKEEEQILERLIHVHGKSWKVIAEKLRENGGRERTAGNVKDKFKQMGEESAQRRDMGPWSVTEGVALMENVCKATGVKAMRSSMKLVVMKES